MTFAIGTVGHTLEQMSGVWSERLEAFDLSGRVASEDALSGSPGPAPWENLVYVSFDGERYVQTNVAYRHRPLATKTFSGRLVDGVLVFDRLGPGDPEHIGVSGGPGVLFFGPRRVTEAWARYHEPDCVRLTGPQTRTRTTLLYRDGVAVRTLTGHGFKVAPIADRRVPWDPRGLDGPPHAERSVTDVFQERR